METTEQIADLRRRIGAWRRSGERIAFVPTMGNLHAGHLALIRDARGRASRVVASIFVNPLQFGPGEDLDAYPRTPEQDREQLAAAGCDLVFAPVVATLYPQGDIGHTLVEVPGLSEILCGAHRPGHFRGVATVVCKLFNLVQPDVAVFGEKDYQQLQVIRRMVADLGMPIEIIGVPTVREPDGLAMSSRNGYLSAGERARAPALHRALRTARAALLAGVPIDRVEDAARTEIRAAGLEPDYVRIYTAGMDLRPATPSDRDLVILAAARLGRTRLIDNVTVHRTADAAPQQGLR